MDKSSITSKIELLLRDIGYFDLEFQSITKTVNNKLLYEYIGYADALMFIRVFISEQEVEVMDCYITEKNYVQSKKLTLEEFLNYRLGGFREK